MGWETVAIRRGMGKRQLGEPTVGSTHGATNGSPGSVGWTVRNPLWPVLALNRLGSYPDDKSPYGVIDMAGNVEEWVSNRSDGLRLTKGGSFVHSQPYNFLCARRFAHHSVVLRALDYIGFRCAKTGDGPPTGSEGKGSTTHRHKNFSSGALPPIEVGKYLKEPIRLSSGIHGNLEEFKTAGSCEYHEYASAILSW